MDEEIMMQETPMWKKVIFYILSALFPAVGLMFFVDQQMNENRNYKGYYLTSLISASVLTAFYVIMSICLGTIDGFLFGGLNFRKFSLIMFTCLLFNSIAYLVFNRFYFDKLDRDTFKRRRAYLVPLIMAIILTVGMAVLDVYFLDEIVTSFPRGFPFDKFEYSSETPVVAFYAICILTGALVAWVIARNKAKLSGYSREVFGTIFYLAFPAGIIGARAWWVISEWNRELAGHHTIGDIFNFRGGGLAIQGGVLLGALVGMWFICEFHREIKLKKAMDLCIPGILIAQAIGRFGNFFNFEVYGAEVDPASWWWVPKVIVTHFQVASGGHFYVPLFLIEGLLNVLGYFIITYVLGEAMKKVIKNGDLSFAYLVWYGTVRYILEPLRNPIYQMPTSMQMSLAFIIAGLVLIVLNHLYEFLITREKWFAFRDKSYERFHGQAEKFEALDKWKRILLCLPIVHSFSYTYYRFIKGHYFSAILNIFVGGTVFWLVDLIYILIDKPLPLTKSYV